MNEVDFKVGDRVDILPYPQFQRLYWQGKLPSVSRRCSWDTVRKAYCGRTFTILEIRDGFYDGYKAYRFKRNGAWLPYGMFQRNNYLSKDDFKL